MIFHTPEEFLANAKVGMTFWLVGKYIGEVQEPKGPFTLTEIYEVPDGLLKGSIKVKTDSKSVLYDDMYVSSMHGRRKIASTTLEEAHGYYDRKHTLEKSDYDRMIEILSARSESEMNDRLAEQAERYDSGRGF